MKKTESVFSTVNLIMFAHGLIIGWVSPAIQKLMSENTPLISGPLTNEQISWIASINFFGALFGSFSSGYFTSTMGSKRSALILAIPSVVFWMLIAFGNSYFYILVARWIAGFSGGGMQTATILYVSEIANDE